MDEQKAMEEKIRDMIREELGRTVLVQRATMTMEEAAHYIGVSYDTMADIARRKMIPHIQTGGRKFFRKDTIDNWMSEQEKLNFKPANLEGFNANAKEIRVLRV